MSVSGSELRAQGADFNDSTPEPGRLSRRPGPESRGSLPPLPGCVQPSRETVQVRGRECRRPSGDAGAAQTLMVAPRESMRIFRRGEAARTWLRMRSSSPGFIPVSQMSGSCCSSSRSRESVLGQ